MKVRGQSGIFLQLHFGYLFPGLSSIGLTPRDVFAPRTRLDVELHWRRCFAVVQGDSKDVFIIKSPVETSFSSVNCQCILHYFFMTRPGIPNSRLVAVPS